TRIPVKRAIGPSIISIVIVDHKCTVLQTNELKFGVVNFDFSAMEVCNVKVIFAVQFGNRAAFVDSILIGIVFENGCSGATGPPCNRSAFSHENEPGRRGGAGQQKTGGAVEYHSGRFRRSTLTHWNGDGNNSCALGTNAVIKRR